MITASPRLQFTGFETRRFAASWQASRSVTISSKLRQRRWFSTVSSPTSPPSVRGHRGVHLPRPGKDAGPLHVRFFVNGSQVWDLACLLRPADRLVIVPALSGG
jgi:hypothetical protein